MRLNKFFIASLLLAALSISCNKDDDNSPDVIPDRDRGEQESEDQAALEEYLATHCYNYEEFENPGSNFDYAVRLDTIKGANADKTPLVESDKLQKKTFKYQDVEYTIYILHAREGAGEQPKFSDSTFVTYKGELLNGTRFDGSNTPVWFDAVMTIPGFGQGLSEFRGATGFEINDDNTITWENDFGVGTLFIPSGLAYFSTPRPTIPAYSPLIFSIQMFAVNEADHDRDGIPSYLEDLNGDQILDNDDTDGDFTPNFMDADDDGDFTPTRDEIEILEDGTLILTDTNEDGTPDYLDKSTY